MIRGSRTVAIYCLEERQEEKTASFADSIEDMKNQIRFTRRRYMQEFIFRTRVLPASYYELLVGGAAGVDPFDRANQRLKRAGKAK